MKYFLAAMALFVTALLINNSIVMFGSPSGFNHAFNVVGTSLVFAILIIPLLYLMR